ncbi:sulfotransferase family protein [Nonomuraea aridisoli]|uniref:Sulfotransferase family protein n=1 Tax=Nonomuraea aridisoli TaxID=2070368 RepID=A0A2W2F378_9ACTN|nr:sulfotransferase [Nonomuraea aridisoli]PZG15967.1 sulfotransferase family protein [Nonomuraea aridisoli]
MGVVNTGFKRRARLLGEALRPPRQLTMAEPKEVRDLKEAKTPRPPKRTQIVDYNVPIMPRQVDSPVFVIASVRSGSTLLRMLLNSHSRIRAPHELHLRTINVQLTPGFSEQSMQELGLDQIELEHVLWDRILQLELERSGKDVIVDKTPGNVFTWERLKYAWPNAKFLILLRHPEGVVSSLENRKGNTSTREALEANALKYFKPLDKARRTLGGLTVRYEELTAEPERVTREICAYLGVEWEPGMLEYGKYDHGDFVPNLGDRSDNIKSGRIQAARTFATTSPSLAKYAKAWGYTT